MVLPRCPYSSTLPFLDSLESIPFGPQPTAGRPAFSSHLRTDRYGGLEDSPKGRGWCAPLWDTPGVTTLIQVESPLNPGRSTHSRAIVLLRLGSSPLPSGSDHEALREFVARFGRERLVKMAKYSASLPPGLLLGGLALPGGRVNGWRLGLYLLGHHGPLSRFFNEHIITHHLPVSLSSSV